MGAEKLETAVRREQIAQAALDLAAARGIRGMSVAAVAREVGIVPSALYRHFRGKDQILDAALDLVRDRLLGNVETSREESSHPVEVLRLLLMRHARLIRQNLGIPRVIFSAEASGGRPGRRAKVLGIVRSYLDRVAGIVRQGQKQGAIRRDVDPGTAALVFLGLVQPGAVLWHLSDGGFDIMTHADQAWRFYESAMRAPGRRSIGKGRGAGRRGKGAAL